MQESNKEIHIEILTEDLEHSGFNSVFQQGIESDEKDPGFQTLDDEEKILTIQDTNSEAKTTKQMELKNIDRYRSI